MADLRASDDDRSTVVAALHRHIVAGRLTLDEFDQRVSLAYRAVTRGDLAAVTRDLPLDLPTDVVEPAAGPAEEHRHLLIAFLIAAVVVAALGVVLAFGR